MFWVRSNVALAASLVFAVLLWGANNTGTKYIVTFWPPIWTGATRFLCAGCLMLALLRWTNWLGGKTVLTPSMKRRLWWSGGLSFAVYIICFNWALRCTSASHVALYLGASPVWALLWEERPARNRESVRRYAAAVLALAGVFVLFWPTLATGGGSWVGEVIGLAASVLWTNFGRQCRALGADLSGAEVTAHTMWRAGALLLLPGCVEISRAGLPLSADVISIQLYCIVAGSVAAYAIWNHALRRWPASQVLLFTNLIPASTMVWAHFCLNEPVTSTFWTAMILIIAGVVLGQAKWQRLLPASTLPPE